LNSSRPSGLCVVILLHNASRGGTSVVLRFAASGQAAQQFDLNTQLPVRRKPTGVECRDETVECGQQVPL